MTGAADAFKRYLFPAKEKTRSFFSSRILDSVLVKGFDARRKQIWETELFLTSLTENSAFFFEAYNNRNHL